MTSRMHRGLVRLGVVSPRGRAAARSVWTECCPTSPGRQGAPPAATSAPAKPVKRSAREARSPPPRKRPPMPSPRQPPERPKPRNPLKRPGPPRHDHSAIEAQATTLDPQNGAARSTLLVTISTYDSLVGRDNKTKEIIPRLTKSWGAHQRHDLALRLQRA